MQSKKNRKRSSSTSELESAQTPAALAGLGCFCAFFGNTIHNQVLEYILEHEDIDFAIGDVASWLGISRPKAYEYVYRFERAGLLSKSRIVAGAQLFRLASSHPMSTRLLQVYKILLKPRQ